MKGLLHLYSTTLSSTSPLVVYVQCTFVHLAQKETCSCLCSEALGPPSSSLGSHGCPPTQPRAQCFPCKDCQAHLSLSLTVHNTQLVSPKLPFMWALFPNQHFHTIQLPIFTDFYEFSSRLRTTVAEWLLSCQHQHACARANYATTATGSLLRRLLRGEGRRITSCPLLAPFCAVDY